MIPKNNSKKGFIFTFDLIFIAGIIITLLSFNAPDFKKPYFDYSYISSEKTINYYFNSDSDILITFDSNSYICYETIKYDLNASVNKRQFCYGGYYEK